MTNTHRQREARISDIRRRTSGKPHFYLPPGEHGPRWLFAGSVIGLSHEDANATWDFLTHLDEVYGYE